VGTWQVDIQNDGRYQVELHKWSITFHGTTTDPNPPITTPEPATEKPAPPAKPAVPAPAKPAVPAPAKTAVPAPAKPQPAAAAAPVQPKPTLQPAPVPEVKNNVQVESLGQPMWQTQGPTNIDNCLVQGTANQCMTCKPGFLVLSGKCVTSCPPQGYYQVVSDLSAHCVQCYYSCATCTGNAENQCLTCYADAELEASEDGSKRCLNKNLVFKVFSSSRWYYILTVGFLVNTILIVLLLVYILRRNNKKGGLYRGNLMDRVIPTGKGYSPVSPVMSGEQAAFHDEELTSDEEVGRGFMTPYSDNPKSKPYRDDEN